MYILHINYKHSFNRTVQFDIFFQRKIKDVSTGAKSISEHFLTIISHDTGNSSTWRSVLSDVLHVLESFMFKEN